MLCQQPRCSRRRCASDRSQSLLSLLINGFYPAHRTTRALMTASVWLAFSTRRFFICFSVNELVLEQRPANANEVDYSRHNTPAQRTAPFCMLGGIYTAHFIAVCSRFSSGTQPQKTFAQFALCSASCLAAGSSKVSCLPQRRNSRRAEASLDQNQHLIGTLRRRAPETRNKGNRRRDCSDMSHKTQRVALEHMPILCNCGVKIRG